MKKFFLVFAASLLCLSGCTDNDSSKNKSSGIIVSVTASGTQSAGYGRGGQVGASGHIKVNVKLKSGNEYLGKNLRNEIKYNNSTIYNGNQDLKENYTFEFDCSFTYNSGVDQLQKQTLTIYNGSDAIGSYSYTASIDLKTPDPGEDL